MITFKILMIVVMCFLLAVGLVCTCIHLLNEKRREDVDQNWWNHYHQMRAEQEADDMDDQLRG